MLGENDSTAGVDEEARAKAGAASSSLVAKRKRPLRIRWGRSRRLGVTLLTLTENEK